VNFRTPWRIVFKRFPSTALEQSYRLEQRSRQAGFIRTLALIAAALTLGSWVINFSQAQQSRALAIASLQLTYVPILLLYAWWVGRPAYIAAWWSDILLFVIIQPIILRSVELVPYKGWPFYAQFSSGLAVSIGFACICFTAAFPAFMALVVGSVGYLWAILTWRGYDVSIVSFTTYGYVGFAVPLGYMNWAVDNKARYLFATRVNLAAEREKSEALLANMLPAPVAERLKSHEAVADAFDDIVVVFIDLVGFTPLSQKLGPKRIVDLLNSFFERADRGTDLFGLEKVKTIGDAYMAVAGALVPTPRPAKAAVDFAVWLRGEAQRVGQGFGIDLRLHVGIARGPAIGGVTGAKRFSYDYWGPTVNLAARLQDSVGADGIAVSEAVFRAIGDSYAFRQGRRVMLKGLGATAVYDLDLDAERFPAQR